MHAPANSSSPYIAIRLPNPSKRLVIIFLVATSSKTSSFVAALADIFRRVSVIRIWRIFIVAQMQQ